MLAETDWAGVASVIAAIGVAVPSILAAYWARGAKTQTATPDNSPTIGIIAASNAAALDHVHDVVCGDKKDPEPAP